MSLRDALTGSANAAQDVAADGRPSTLSSRFLATTSRLEITLWIVAIVGMILDVILTVYGLRIGLRELNPVARSLLGIAGIYGLFALKGAVLVLAIGCRQLLAPKLAGVIPLGLAIPTTVAVVNNSILILYVSV